MHVDGVVAADLDGVASLGVDGVAAVGVNGVTAAGVDVLILLLLLLLSLGMSGRAGPLPIKDNKLLRCLGIETIPRVRCSWPNGSEQKERRGDFSRLSAESGYISTAERRPR